MSYGRTKPIEKPSFSGRLRSVRQLHDEGRSFAGSRSYADGSMVPVYDALHHGQTDALSRRAFRMKAAESGKDVVGGGVRNPEAVIFDVVRVSGLPYRAADFDPQRPRGIAILQRIPDQITEDL